VQKIAVMQTGMILMMLAVYVGFTGWLTLLLRSRSSGEFMVASRAMPASVVGVLLMSEFIGAKSTVGTAQEAFQSGMAAAWSVLGAAIGFLLFGLLFAKRIYSSGSYTISGAIQQRYGKSTMITVSLIMIYALLLVNVANIMSGAAALAAVMNVNIPWAMVIIAVLGTFYSVLGGMKGAAWLTLVHTAVKLVGIGVVVYTALSLTGGVTPMIDRLPHYYFTWDGKLGPSTVVAWTVGTVGAIFSTQHIILAVSTSRTAAGARRASFYAAAMSLPLGLLFAVIGVAARLLYPSLNSLYALPVFLGAMSPVLAGFVAMGILASVLIAVTTVGLGIRL